ncbi:MAG: DNA repair protein RecO [Micrococcales bacterium]
MPTYRDEAVILRTHKLGEADRIVTCLTKSHGQVRAVAKGVRRTASKFGARLEPFMVADIQFFEGRNLDTVTQAETLSAYGAQIVDDYASYTAATAMVETAERLTGEMATPQQYLLLVGGLRSLAALEHKPSHILDSYLLRALSIAGWAPNFVECVRCGKPGSHRAFVIQVGGVVCDDCKPMGAALINESTSKLLGALLAGEWAIADAVDEPTTVSASGIVAAYAQYHIERGLKSLQHVELE